MRCARATAASRAPARRSDERSGPRGEYLDARGAIRSTPTSPARIRRITGRRRRARPAAGDRAAERVHAVANQAFRTFVLDDAFSCLGAKSSISRGLFRFGTYARLDDPAVTAGLARDLYAFAAERGLRERLHDLRRRLSRTRRAAVKRVSSAAVVPAAAAARPRRALSSLGSAGERRSGRSRFLVQLRGQRVLHRGMHPQASRAARRFAWPALVFNAHEQFERLREDGRYGGLQRQIRERELRLDGDLNPNLADYGRHSEARQYSGRATEGSWRCPFRPGADRDPAAQRDRLRARARCHADHRRSAGRAGRRPGRVRAGDPREHLSNGRTFDYEQTLALTAGNRLWSNRSRPLLTIVRDDVGQHDFLLTPCSRDTWAICYGGRHDDVPGCFGNLATALRRSDRARRDPDHLQRLHAGRARPRGRLAVRPRARGPATFSRSGPRSG